MKKIKSPDIDVNWLDLKEVKKYYASFDEWSFYISNGCKYVPGLVEVKDGIALFNQEYYLPAGGKYNDTTCKKEIPYTDGFYYANLYKRGFGFYSHQPSEFTANVFQACHESPYTLEKIKDFERRTKYVFKSTYNKISEEDIAHIKSLNLSQINSKELDFVKGHMSDLWSDLLPFKAKNGVTISKWNSFSNPLQCSKGLLYVDNSYHGHTQHGFQYGAMLKFHPSFSNEHKYYQGVNISKISLDGLENIAIAIEKSVQLYSKI